MPRDDQGRFVSERDIPKYDVTVWDLSEGDVVESQRDATEAELEEIEERYRDEPGVEIQVEDKSI